MEPRLIFVEENIQGEPTTTFVLNVQVVCMCVLSYGSLSIELSINTNAKCRKVWSCSEPCSVDDKSDPCIEFYDPKIAYVLHYSSTIISYILNVRMLGLNPQKFNLY